MNRQELINSLVEFKILHTKDNILQIKAGFNKNINKCPTTLSYLISYTSFLHPEDLKHKHSLRLRLHTLILDVKTSPRCKGCENLVRFWFDGKFRNTWRGFCSHTCASKHKDTQLKAQQTCFKNRKTTHQSRCPKVQAQTVATNMAIYGVERPSQLKKFREKAKETCRKTYGFDYAQQCPKVQEKTKETCRKRFGTDFVLSSPIIREKIIETNIKNHGVKHNVQRPDIRKQIEETNQVKYGEKYFLCTEAGRKKSKETIQKKYKVTNISQSPEIKQRKIDTGMKNRGYGNPSQCPLVQKTIIKNNNIKFDRDDKKQMHIPKTLLSKLNDRIWLNNQHINEELSLVEIAQSLGVNNSTVRNYMLKHKLDIVRHAKSIGEKQLADFLVESGIANIVTNSRSIINPQEIDIYLPDYKVAIEYCGLYWHTDAHDRIGKNYHLNKLKACKSQGIRLLTIFEDEWEDKQQQVKNKILSTLGLLNQETVYPRKCEVVNLSTTQRQEFLERNHIQGDGRGSITYALTHDNDIISVMSLFKRKQKDVWELNRYATSCNVPGGFSKLLKHFQRNNKWVEIVSFADMCISDGDMYERTGWTLDKTLYPDYHYLYKGSRVNKRQFRHHNLSKMLENYDPDLTETQNTENHNIFKIWNCGLLRYKIENK